MVKTDLLQESTLSTTGEEGAATGSTALHVTGYLYALRVAFDGAQPSTCALTVYDAKFPETPFLSITKDDLGEADAATFFITMQESDTDGAATESYRLPFLAGRSTPDLIFDVTAADPAANAVIVRVQMAGAEY